MKSFSLLHLSDLHISSTLDPNHDRLRCSLIKDAIEYTNANDISIDAIALTGDLVDRGGSPAAFRTAKDFLNDILKGLSLTSDNLVIVPGNHDIPRRRLLIPAFEVIHRGGAEDELQSNEYWETFGPRFSSYDSFREDIMGLNNYIKGSYESGIKSITTNNGTVQFILLNSAWGSMGDGDHGKLLIGRWQLESIATRRNTMGDLSIALLHHPLEWLEPADRKMVVDYLRDENRLKVDAILHGHVHTGEIDSISDPDGSLIYLVSGIGYPEIDKRGQNEPKLAECRYAIYNFHVDKGLVEIWLRISRNDGFFVSDTHLYKAGGRDGHFTIPFRTSGIPKAVQTMEIEVDPVPIVSDWVGRQGDIEKLLNPKFRAIAITGVGGQGKSALAAEFLKRYARGNNPLFNFGVWVDCRELPTSIHMQLIFLLDALSFGEESAALYRDEKIAATIRRFLRHLQSNRYLIVFDNIDAYINSETENVTAELKPVVDAILNGVHNSLVLLTCRPPFNDHRGFFCHLQLAGLKTEDGIELFKKRGVKLHGANAEQHCRRIVELTKGHPWWLGLIVGQILSGQDNLRDCVKKLGRGQGTARGRIREYVEGIWAQLDNRMKKMLRYLVEASRPLTYEEIDIAVKDFTPNRKRQIIDKIQRMGFLESHEVSNNKTAFQVHPLFREFIYERYSSASQRPYVLRILHVFLPSFLIEKLFLNASELDQLGPFSLSPLDLAESIETCLNSRNETQASHLLERYYFVLNNLGYHHRLVSLGCRLLENIDWTAMINRHRGAAFLAQVVYLLDCTGDTSRCSEYLQRYYKLVKKNTLSELWFLSLASYMAWQQGDCNKALFLADAYESLSQKLSSQEWVFEPMSFTLALALRDSGQYDKALGLFIQETVDSAPKYGNIGRCYLLMGNYPEGEKYIRTSLKKLSLANDYVSRTNCGYAYLWLAEAYSRQKRFIEAKAFLALVRDLWTSYAPGLLPKLEVFANSLDEEMADPVSLLEAKEFGTRFLDGEIIEFQSNNTAV